MPKTNYIFLVLGEGYEYFKQLYLALISTRSFASENAKFIVYTDSRNKLGHLSNFCELREISENKKKEWLGPFNFFYRIKLMILQDSIKKDIGNTVFLDTDIMAISDLKPFEKSIDTQMAFMHTKESPLYKDRSPDKVSMWNAIKGKEFYGIKMNQDVSMWNSGVIAIPSSTSMQIIDEAIDITDEFCKMGIECRIKEQFAIGIVMQKYYHLNSSTNLFIHYWGNKEEWTKEIEAWSSSRYIEGIAPETPISNNQLNYFQSLPIQRTPRSFGKSLIKIQKNFYKDRTKTHRETFPNGV